MVSTGKTGVSALVKEALENILTNIKIVSFILSSRLGIKEFAIFYGASRCSIGIFKERTFSSYEKFSKESSNWEIID